MKKAKNTKNENGVNPILGNKFGFKSLDDVFSKTKRNKYQTLKREDYETQIKRMNIAELQNHAISLGIKPSRNRNMLEKNLISLFRKNNGEQFGVVQAKTGVKNIDQVLDILSK